MSAAVSVVIPVFNERENLPRVLDELRAFAATRPERIVAVIVDDGSTDGSIDSIDSIDTGHIAASQHLAIRVLRHPRNRGLTAALRTGFFAADTELVTWLPADGQIAAAELGKLFDARRGEDLVLSTYSHRPDGLFRAVMSRTLRLMLVATTGLTLRLEGVYLLRRAALDDLQLVTTRSAGSIGFEIAAKLFARERPIGTVEIACRARLSGRSKVASLRNVALYCGELVRIRRSMKQMGLR